MYPLFLVIVLVPIISHFQAVHARWGTELDLLFFWKDKILWALSFLSLFFIKKSSPWVILFWGFLFWSTLFSIDMIQSIWGMANYSEGSITFFCYGILFLAASCLSEKKFNLAISISVCVMGSLALCQIFYGNYLMFPPIKILSGLRGIETFAIKFPLYMSLANPNHLGLYCALLFPVFIRLPNYYLSLVLLSLAAGSGSRGAWVSILLTLPKRFWKWLPLAGAFLLFFFYNSIVPKFVLSTSGRFFIWSHSWRLLHLFGRGPATFMMDFPQNLIAAAGTGWPKDVVVDRPHNMYIQIAHATGILSLIPIAILVWGAVKRESPYRYGIFGFLICGLFTDSMVAISPIFCIMLGLCYLKDRECSLESNGKDLS